tara:strand:- start:3535 stop:4185 length:651 start_codon:yes stop_codon:yes gene_type:complete
MFLNNLHKSIFIISLFFISFAYSQSDEKSSRKLKKVGFLYNSAKQNNVLFFDDDYDYKTSVFKAQFFYHLKQGKKWSINLIFQPQFQIAKHQLLNEQFITPDEPNFEELRAHLTQKKTISFYAFELGLQFRRKLFKQVFFEATLGLGAGYIDVESERLAQGFTFLENISLGLTHTLKNSEFYLGTNIGHVSNLDFQLPNSGYNVLGFEIGYRIYLK